MNKLNKTVTIYSSPSCPNCNSMKDFFKANNIEYIEKDTTKDFKAKAKLISLGFKTLPIIELVLDDVFERIAVDSNNITLAQSDILQFIKGTKND